MSTYQEKSGIGVYVKWNDTLLSFLQSNAHYYELPLNKEKLLSYIFCSEIAICKFPILNKNANSHITQSSIYLEEDFFSNNTIEIMRDHKYVLKVGMLVIYVQYNKFVSRGGNKLQEALKKISYTVKDKIWLDCGTSTGGFTDCLLKAGAYHIYAIDVGYNQFDFRLKKNKKITLMERTNVLSLQSSDFSYGNPHAAVVDVSFRSLSKFLSYILQLISDTYILALCKPQFELAYFKKKQINSSIATIPFNGVVEDKYLIDILYSVLLQLHKENVYVHTIIPSQLKGNEGNKEFFFEIYNFMKNKERENSTSYYKKMSIQAVEDSGI